MGRKLREDCPSCRLPEKNRTISFVALLSLSSFYSQVKNVGGRETSFLTFFSIIASKFSFILISIPSHIRSSSFPLPFPYPFSRGLTIHGHNAKPLSLSLFLSKYKTETQREIQGWRELELLFSVSS